MNSALSTPAAEVLQIVDWMDRSDVVYQINGGWGVDALLGEETRPHQDVDVFIDREVVDELIAWLIGRGYSIVQDWRPVRLELASGLGRVDVHPMMILANGDGVQQGMDDQNHLHAVQDRVTGAILGRPVVVASAERVRQLRRGYELRTVDEHDLEQLSRL